MARIQPIAPSAASTEVQAQYKAVAQKLGGVPNLIQTMGNSPAVVEAYLGMSGGLGKASLSAAEREAIALTVAGANRCEYCAAAHTAIGKGLKLEPAELTKHLHGQASNARTQALLSLAHEIVVERGFVSDASVAKFRAAGLGDRELAELVAVVSLNLFTNYFNHVAQTQVDFPAVALPQAVGSRA